MDTKPIPRKCVVVGSGAVGKTTFLIALTVGIFPEYYPGVFDNFQVDRDIDGEHYQMTFWDTAAQEDYDRLRPLSYPQTDIFMVCYNMDNEKDRDERTFGEIMSKWIPEITHHSPGVPFVIVGLKSDLLEGKPKSDFRDRAMKLGAAGYIECSSYHATMKNLDTSTFTNQISLVDVVDLLLECCFSPKTRLKRKVCGDLAQHFGYETAFPPAPVAPQEPTLVLPPSNFNTNLQNLYGLKDMCDITFLPNDDKPGIKAHKFMLCLVCPEFFKTIEPLIDSKTGDCKLEATSRIIELILPSIYFWSSKATHDDCDALQQFSEKYNFPSELASPRPAFVPGLVKPPHPLHSFVVEESLEKEAKNTRFYDVSLAIDYHLMYAHWPLLISRSFFFQSLSESFQPVKGEVTKIPLDRTTVVSHSIWTQILTYIYTDQFADGSNLASLIDLFTQCDRYMLGPHAQALVEEKIKSQIDAHNVVSLWGIVQETKMAYVQDYCLYILCKHKDQLELTSIQQEQVAKKMKAAGWSDQKEFDRYAEFQQALELLKQGKKPIKGFVVPKELQEEKCILQ